MYDSIVVGCGFAGAVVATLVLVAVVGTIMIILESLHVGHVH